MDKKSKELLNCTILVCSCDDYEDLWFPFFKLLKTYWKNCPCKIVLNTESKVFSYPELNIECYRLFDNKTVPYGLRMIEHLKKIDTEYVLVLMDDFFIRKEVNESELIKVIKWLDSDKSIACFSFQHFNDELNIKSKKYLDYEERPKYGEYKLNFQAAIWDKHSLLNFWKKHETPWEWETLANYRTFRTNKKFFVISDDNKIPIDYGFCHSGMGVYRGKWVLNTVEELFKKNDIKIDFTKRGIYKKEDKNIQRMVKTNFFSGEFRKIKSLGIIYYFEIFLWRVKQKILKKDYSNDYIKYMRNKKMCRLFRR